MSAVTNENPLYSIGSLLGKRFFVAQYQRGYKWTTTEVIALLNDIHDFSPARSKGFYCLQPLVVSKRHDGSWELIDGQQRITTIFLIMARMKVRGVEMGNFEIDYQTRLGSTEFLKGAATMVIDAKSEWDRHRHTHANADHIDNFHFFEASKAIVNWLEGKSVENPNAATAFSDKLLNQTAVLWHEIKSGDNYRAFLNLNSGRIPLTQSELIRGVFLKSNEHIGNAQAFRLRQTEIAQEWDRIEYALRNDSFWFFINRNASTVDSGPRIGFVFDVLPSARPAGAARFESYLLDAARNELDVEKEWEAVKRCFLTLQEWFEDQSLYHLIGFLIARGGAAVKSLVNECSKVSKSQFRKDISTKIRARISGKELRELRFNEPTHKQRIGELLLLFNLESILRSRVNVRFPFEAYRSENWSLEHIHAQNSQQLKGRDQWNAWAKDVSNLLKNSEEKVARELHDEVIAWLEQESPDEQKEAVRIQLEAKLYDHFGGRNEEDLHGLGNLALLGRGMNSALGNGWFPSKREKVIEWDKAGLFIPIETKNVFLKYYSVDSMQIHRWTLADQEAYLARIEEILSPYLK